MKVDVVIPEFSESISEGVIGDWLKNAGDEVEEGETLVEVETDKVVLEIPSPAKGVLETINKNVNDTVVSGDVIGVLSAANKAKTISQKGNQSDEIKASKLEETHKAQQSSPIETEKAIKTVSSVSEKRVSVKTSPAVRKLLNEHGLDKNDIAPTGKSGRITKSDVIAAVNKGSAKSHPIRETGSNLTEGSVERVPMSSLRKRIAQRLVSAQNDYAMLTTFNEVNMQGILSIREKHKEQFQAAHGVKLGFMSFFVAAAVEALREYPAVNASIEDDDIVYHRYMDVGIAVSSERGLVVPIVRNADVKSLSEVEIEISQLADKARENKLTIDDLSGGTFTITNGGVFGSMLSTPIVNPPQSAILGMHAIEKRPVVQGDEIVIRPMMYLALSYDHRIIDGREAVLFLSHVK
ncbi:MAG: 2-oxoglutarate dehydrogenase complex dihydrolipoyllysine-residue succinyltransferase, partial [Pseudomonadota bacterium]